MKKLIGFVFLLSVVILSAQTENITLHTVATGETLYSIARIYNVSPSSILLANGITDKEVKLQLNQKLKIPAKVFINKAPKAAASPVTENARVANTPFSKEGDLLIHTVQKGETFYSIIRQYKVLAYDVISVNNLPNTLVKEGQKLILPSNATIPDINDLQAAPPATTKTEPVLPVKENIKSPISTKTEAARPAATLAAVEDNATRKNVSDGPAHTIAKGETIYAIGRMYGVSASEIIKLNNIKGDEYKVGQVLMIPKRNTNTKASTVVIKDTIPVASKEKEEGSKEAVIAPVAGIEKIVVKQEDSKTPKKATPAKKEQKQKEKPKENITIAEETMAEAKMITDKKEVKQEAAPIENKEPAVVKTEEKENTVIENVPVKAEPKKIAGPDEYGNVFAGYAQNGLTMKKSRGTAVYLSESTVGNPSLALYNGADIGSILKVTNLMNKKSTYVKVIGRIPGAEASSALLKVSSKVAEQLNVLDDTFLVEVSCFSKN